MNKQTKGFNFFKTSQRVKVKKNIFLTAFVIFFVGGYFLFFTSKAWLPSNGTLHIATSENKVNLWEKREVALVSWKYSEAQHMMEIQLDVKNTSLDGINSYTFSAIDRKKGNLEVEKVIEEPNFIVLRIVNIESGWAEISLRMDLIDKEKDSTTLKLYTNKDVVETTKEIKDNTLEQYTITKLENTILKYESAIKKLEKNDSEITLKIQSSEKNIAEFEASKKYQTEQEITDTNTLIKKAETEIQTFEKTIEENKTMVIEYSKRIENAKDQIKEYK